MFKMGTRLVFFSVVKLYSNIDYPRRFSFFSVLLVLDQTSFENHIYAGSAIEMSCLTLFHLCIGMR